MKKRFLISSLLLSLLMIFSSYVNACGYYMSMCGKYQGQWCGYADQCRTNQQSIEEVVVIGQKTTTPPLNPSTYLISPKNESLISGQVYRGPGLPPELQKICANMDVDHSTCKVNAQNNYTQQIRSCKNHVIVGSTTGAAGLTAATFLTGGWALIAIGVGGAGAGSAGYGASSCYNDKAAIRDTNLAICDENLSKTKKNCTQ